MIEMGRKGSGLKRGRDERWRRGGEKRRRERRERREERNESKEKHEEREGP